MQFLDGDRQNSAFAGFTTAFDGNMVLLAGYSGKHNIVYNIGLGVKKLSPDGVPVQQWAQSQQHKVCVSTFKKFLYLLILLYAADAK